MFHSDEHYDECHNTTMMAWCAVDKAEETYDEAAKNRAMPHVLDQLAADCDRTLREAKEQQLKLDMLRQQELDEFYSGVHFEDSETGN